MKRYLFLSFLALAFLFSCSLNLRESERMAAALEQAESVYGEGSLLMEVDTALFIPGLSDASLYYARKKQFSKAALAALYNGYSEKDYNKDLATNSFKEAERYGEMAHDSLTMARAEYWMGKFLHEAGRIEAALSAFETSYYLIGERYAERAFIENSLAVTYIMLKQYDSAEYYLNNSLTIARDIHSERLERKVLNNLAVLYRIQGRFEKSIDCLRKILSLPDLEKSEKGIVLLNFGNTFMANREFDSAALYFRLLADSVLDSQIKTDTKLSIYGALLNFAENQGNLSAALQYREKHEDLLYEVMLQRQEQSIYRIQKQYDYENIRNTMNKKIIRRHRVIIVFGFLLLFLSIVILFLQHRHHQMLIAEEEMKHQLFAMKESLGRTVSVSILDKTVVSRLKIIIVANHATNRAKDPKNEWRPLVFEIMAGKENVYEAAKTVIEEAYPNLFSTILKTLPELNDTEAKVCMMSCFDLTNSEIAELLGLSINTINQNRSTLRRKLNLRPEKMSEQLHNIISQ